MSKICGWCSGEIQPVAEVKRGLHSQCYQKAWRRGLLSEYQTKRVPDEVRENQVNRYLELVRSGMNQIEACAQIGIGVATMRNRLAVRGLTSKGEPTSTRSLHGKREEIAEKYWLLRGSGFHDLSMSEMAQKIGVSDRTLYRALKEKEYEW